MKLGFSIPNNQGIASVAELVDVAVAAEALGYNSVWVSEHLFHSTYVAKRLGSKPYHDPLTVLTAVACSTKTVRLGTSVLVLPWHHPARLGKAIASLDNLSCGRVDLGIGVAITEDEFENLGIDFRTRGRRTDDVLAALDALWYQDIPEHDGEFYQFTGQRFEPKPIQQKLPIHVGGGSAAALARTVRSGGGWHALGKSPVEFAADKAELSQLLNAAKRDISDLHMSIRCVVDVLDEPWDRPVEQRRTLRGTPDEIAATITAFSDAGVDEIVIDANSGDLSQVEKIMRQAVELV